MKGNVLLVDDNLDFLDSTKDVLEDQGYQVDTATNGEDALNQVNNHPFDVILMDIKMPRMNGVESFIKMKKKNPQVKVILFTAYSLETLIQRARSEGVCEVLNKPLDMVRLFHTIEKVRKSREGGCILIADDDRALCDSLFDILSQKGYEVAVTGDGQKAVSKAKNKPFDILLLDMKLPHSNGLEVYRQIKSLQPNLVAIIMTGYAEEMRELIDQTLKENAHTCLAKPLKIETLIELLDEIIVAKNEGRYHKKGR
jgi:DNA-binding NtrC family response regulator